MKRDNEVSLLKKVSSGRDGHSEHQKENPVITATIPRHDPKGKLGIVHYRSHSHWMSLISHKGGNKKKTNH